MVFMQLHRRSCYLKVYLFWLNYVRASVTYDTKLHEDCLSNVYTLYSSAHIWWNSRDDRLTKKASMTRNFWNVKEGFKWSRGASFQVVRFQKKITSVTWMKVILAVICTTQAVVKIRPEKIQACTGFEPMTSAIPVQRSTNWANKPTGSWSWSWF